MLKIFQNGFLETSSVINQKLAKLPIYSSSESKNNISLTEEASFKIGSGKCGEIKFLKNHSVIFGYKFQGFHSGN